MKSTLRSDNEIDVEDNGDALDGRFGRVRIYEQHGGGRQKCSIFLTADQLEDHAQTCLALAANIKRRQRP